MKLKNILVGVEILKMNNFKNYNIKTINKNNIKIKNDEYPNDYHLK